jgi:phosphoenolpyruvate carboxykinase (ATP)
VNTGWNGGAYGVGERIDLRFTRAIIDAIYSGDLDDAKTVTDEIFGLTAVVDCPGVPGNVLHARKAWSDGDDETARDLAHKFP